jgi:hypothetical protein
MLIKNKPVKWGTPLRDWYDKNITEMAADRYYDKVDDVTSEDYIDYRCDGGTMSFSDWLEWRHDEQIETSPDSN